MFTTSMYTGGPRWAQELLISARALARNILREDACFHRLLADALCTQWLSADELRQYQFENMSSLLTHVSKHVPYYAQLLDRRGLSLDNFRTLNDFSQIPCLIKRDVLEAGGSLLATNIRYGRIKGSTSGTTGTPVTIYQDLSAIRRENAFVWRQLQWAGYKKGQRRAWIRGDMIVPAKQTQAPYWRFNSTDKMLMMSSFHLSEKSAPAYLSALEKFDPVLIQAYPSSIAYLANYLENKNLDYQAKSLHAIVTSSETLTEEQKILVENRFGCRVFDWYGCFERVAAIGTCEHGSYHLISDYSYVELIPQENGTAELVGTGFGNRVMPLIRYRLNDVVSMYNEDIQCPCGRQFPVIKRIQGRLDDCIKTPEGRSVPMVSYNIMKYARNVTEAQIIQDRLNEIRILIVPFSAFTDKDAAAIVAVAREKLGHSMQVEIQIVPEIPRTASGKLKAVICNV